MGNFIFEEINLMCIYNTGSRTGLIEALNEMRGHLEPDETELREHALQGSLSNFAGGVLILLLKPFVVGD